MAIYCEKILKMAKIGQKWPKMATIRNSHRFFTYFQNSITLRIFFTQKSLTPEMKDLKSLFNMKYKPKAHLQPLFQYSV